MEPLHFNNYNYLAVLIESIKSESLNKNVLFNINTGEIIDFGSEAMTSPGVETDKEIEETETQYSERKKDHNWIELYMEASTEWDKWLHELGFDMETRETALDSKHKVLWQARKMEMAYQKAQELINKTVE